MKTPLDPPQACSNCEAEGAEYDVNCKTCLSEHRKRIDEGRRYLTYH